MSKNLRFCYKVDKSVGLSKDEDGNLADFYICLKAKDVKYYIVKKETYKEMQDAFRKLAANQLKCDEKLLTPITINEYLDETGTDI